jgi:hypothetical protein
MELFLIQKGQCPTQEGRCFVPAVHRDLSMIPEFSASYRDLSDIHPPNSGRQIPATPDFGTARA